MALPKSTKADLKRKYKRTLEISFVLAIAFLIAAFKYFPNPEGIELIPEERQVIINVEDVAITRHELPPPPPPKPPIPVEAPSDDVLDDVPIGDTEIKMGDNVPPPPQPYNDDKNSNDDNDVIFIAVEEMPAPIGGLKGILERLEYPEMARRAGIEGRVTVKALVDKNGNVESVELVRGIGMGCDDEAMRVIKETKFKPGKQRGKAVKVYVNIPIKFDLN